MSTPFLKIFLIIFPLIFVENVQIFCKRGLTFLFDCGTMKKMGAVYPAVAFRVGKAAFFFFLHLIIYGIVHSPARFFLPSVFFRQKEKSPPTCLEGKGGGRVFEKDFSLGGADRALG